MAKAVIRPKAAEESAPPSDQPKAARSKAVTASHAAAGTQSIGRSLTLLRLVAAAGPEGVRGSEVSLQLGLHVATVHRLLAALMREGFVVQDSLSRRYNCGPELLSLAFRAQDRYGLESRLQPILSRLAATTGDVAYASVRAGDEAVCVARCEGSFPIRALPIGPGTRRPLGIGSGSLAILAFLPDAEAAGIIVRNAARYTEFGQTTATVTGFVERAKRDGFALNDGRIIPGMSAVAKPLPSPSGRPTAAIGISAIEARMGPEQWHRVAQLLEAELDTLEPIWRR